MQQVRTEQLTRRFGAVTAVAGCTLTIQPGELFTLLGPSGCGKTTLLRLLAGLEEPDEGRIYFADQPVGHLPAYQRNVGMVFQSYALFPHLSVAENVAYGLKARHLAASTIRTQVQEALALVRMEGYGDRRPDQLSGGQQQRVALARAMAVRPALLLMDEPLSNLDARLRLEMRDEIRRLQRQVGITTVYVTHDQEEALAISDRIGVMEEGRLLQVAEPLTIYRRPAHRKVAAFVGTCSFLGAHLADGQVEAGGARFPLHPSAPDAGPHPSQPGALPQGEAILGLRPESLRPHVGSDAAAGAPALQGVVAGERFAGSVTFVDATLPTGEQIKALSLLPPGTFRPGSPVSLTIRVDEALLFDPRSGGALR